jgi:phosphatidylglycerophosphatase A
MRRLALGIATAGGVGYIPFAPGTFGSLPGLALGLFARWLGGPAGELASIAVLFAAGIWASHASESHFGRSDPGPVVIDEVVGMMLTIALVPLGGVGLLVAFLVFRACDIVKPFPANRCERLPGGLGVMMDDVMAGVWAHVAVRALVWVVPQWMLA